MFVAPPTLDNCSNHVFGMCDIISCLADRQDDVMAASELQATPTVDTTQ